MNAFNELRAALESGAVSLDSLMEFLELVATEQDVIDYFTPAEEAEPGDPAGELIDALPDEGYQTLVDYWGRVLSEDKDDHAPLSRPGSA